MKSTVRQYLRDVNETFAKGNATEHSYRPALKVLVDSFRKNISATNEPKREACGAPDFIIDRKDVAVGFIECKDIGKNLDEAEKSEQLQRYFGSLENLILTDYLEFRYYVSGEQKMHVVLARKDTNGKIKAMQGGDVQLEEMFEAFLSASPQPITSSDALAEQMAGIAKVINDAIKLAFTGENKSGTLHNEYESFRQTILHDITVEQFADMYAQTICYGMFSARVNAPDQDADKFDRKHAAFDLPRTNPFLREIFAYIAGVHLDESIVWAVERLVEILRACEMNEVLKDFGKSTRREDPVVHFYETFLAAYDPKMRKVRGVYYTPEPVVDYIVRSVDTILKRDFDCPDGLADNSMTTVDVPDDTKKSGKSKKQVHRVQILDPATGTGTFLHSVIRHIHETLSPNRGLWAGADGYVAKHLLPRLHGFELMMAPYAVAHLKLGMLLRETGYTFPSDDRLRVYLTNTLEEAEIKAPPLLFASQIAKEANSASKIKTQAPIMVVIGNPPYSGLSMNMNKWTDDLLKKTLPVDGGAQGYYEVDGQPLGERKVWLQDDYVKFIRFGQYRIEKTGYGILAFITNHGYLDNPTFRGMRQSLMQTFDDIYVLDLHGNLKKKEVTPDGSPDQNVFDIMQGVAICIMVKSPKKNKNKKTKIKHAEFFGKKQPKYKYLFKHGVATTKWKTLKPNSPHYFFIPRDETARKEYEAYSKVNEVFVKNVTGIVTARDNFVIDFDEKALSERIEDFAKSRDSGDALLEQFGLKENYAWRAEQSRTELRDAIETKSDDDFLEKILYRPFDSRNIFYHQSVVWRPRNKVMRHMLAGKNIGLVFMRQVALADKYSHFLVTKNIIDARSLYSNKGIISLAPLYLYPNGVNSFDQTESWPAGLAGRRPNLSPEFVEDFAKKLKLKFTSDGSGDLKKTFGPEDIFHYAYAVFHSPEYRCRYAEFLKIDFPRLPLTSDKKLFRKLCGLGCELAGLHLLEKVPAPQTYYPATGSNVVERTGKKAYKPPTDNAPGRMYINDEQYFEPVEPEVWEFRVGGYQVCEKWLKDRKGRTLGFDEIETYRKITESLRQTIRLMREIDETIPAWPIV